MLNWRELEAGDELNCLIAERLGWKDIRQENHLESGAWDETYTVTRWCGLRPGKQDREGIWPFSSSIYFAFYLPLAEGVYWQIMTREFAPLAEAKNYQAALVLWVGNGGAYRMLHAFNHDLLSMAMCRAWLAWMDDQRPENSHG